MLTKILRWIAVLPGAILSGVAATFILHFVLYFLLSKFFSSYPEFPERVLTPFAVATVFVIVGTAIAPRYKIATALTLLLLWLTFAIILAIVYVTEMRWFGKEIYFEANGLAMASGIIGGFLGLLLVKDSLRKETYTQTGVEVNEESSQNVKVQKNQDISDLIFISLFVLCVFNDLSRKIIFGFLLAFGLFLIWWTIKEKLYITKNKLLNFIKDCFMAVCLSIGLIYTKTGIYVSIVCASLCAFTFIVRTIRDIKKSIKIAASA